MIDVDFLFKAHSDFRKHYQEPQNELIRYSNEVYTPLEFWQYRHEILSAEMYFKLGLANEKYEMIERSRRSIESSGAKLVNMKCYGHISDQLFYYNIDN